MINGLKVLRIPAKQMIVTRVHVPHRVDQMLPRGCTVMMRRFPLPFLPINCPHKLIFTTVILFLTYMSGIFSFVPSKGFYGALVRLSNLPRYVPSCGVCLILFLRYTPPRFGYSLCLNLFVGNYTFS